jgi:hydroxyethylthiazole kinase
MTNSPDPTSIYTNLREQQPLVQCITNFVSMDIAANVLNAVGASPAMVHDVNEASEFASLSSAVVINIGTLSDPWLEGMISAAKTAQGQGTPWVLDPVAVGATTYRRESVQALLTYSPTVIRGNPSEIRSLATTAGEGRGVDSESTPEAALESARELARHTQAVVAITGEEDLVTDGERTLVVRGGDSRMPMITALGCAVSALVGACCGVESDPLPAAATALAIVAAAGERAGVKADGPGSLRWRLIDELSTLPPNALTGRIEAR